MINKIYNAKEFVSLLSDFLKAFKNDQILKDLVDEQQIIDLFKFWWIDTRDQLYNNSNDDDDFNDMLN